MNRIRNEKKLKALGRRIKLLRKNQHISQAQLAFEASIPRVQIGRIERAQINPTASTLFAIADALNVSVKDLFDF